MADRYIFMVLLIKYHKKNLLNSQNSTEKKGKLCLRGAHVALELQNILALRN